LFSVVPCAWQEWKSSTALRWKESWGAEVLAVSLSFAVRLSERISWGISARLMVDQIYHMEGK
jgi:hypothetical protein